MSTAKGSGPSATLDIFQPNSEGDRTFDPDDVVLEGQMSSGSSGMGGPGGMGGGSSSRFVPPEGFNTLDEPIRETIMRDVRAVGEKFFHVLYPVEKTSLLKVWTNMMYDSWVWGQSF